ncbi:hypothetical protein EPA93_27845 [Ktedonosporobacter rubrisoli]|uniref:Uncharacterized protein n=1 Tax=Ktedonosporobacter rubrisoli TaxID=2509675 RepID=A0A4P6JVL8_KTERU|nr:hypothetical protein [Ktedonosporobacter rubrisoli]QBD79584.1 hypothetical protein EPA93_27845 [Ktedonosporobacter rubrisoli]
MQRKRLFLTGFLCLALIAVAAFASVQFFSRGNPAKAADPEPASLPANVIVRCEHQMCYVWNAQGPFSNRMLLTTTVAASPNNFMLAFCDGGAATDTITFAFAKHGSTQALKTYEIKVSDCQQKHKIIDLSELPSGDLDLLLNTNSNAVLKLSVHTTGIDINARKI